HLTFSSRGVFRMSTPGFSTTIDHWLERYRVGDPTARNELLRHSRERLRLLTRRMLRRLPGVHQFEETSDVLQRLFVLLDGTLSAVESPSSRDFFRLAARHIRNLLIDLSRSLFGPRGPGTNQVPLGSVGETILDGVACAPGEDAYQMALWTEFHNRIAELPEE